MTIWDLRQPAFPASYYTVHEKCSVSDIAFHRTDPTKLFTSSESGELFQWSHKAQQITERIDGQLTVVENENVNPWLCGQRTKSRINVSYFECFNNWISELTEILFLSIVGAAFGRYWKINQLFRHEWFTCDLWM